MRGQFFRRIGCAFALMAFFSGGLIAVLYWVLNGNFHPAPVFGNHLTRLILIFFGMAVLFLAGRAIRRMAIPIGDLLDAAGRIANGDYSVRVPERGTPEVRGLARAFNSMAERLQTNDRQRRALLADVSHELRTPLTIVQGNLEGMLDGVYPADQEHLQSLLEETHVLSHIIDDLRTLSLAEAGALKLQVESSDLAGLVEDTAAAFQAQARRSSITLETLAQPGLPELEIDPTRIRQVLTNLLVNALRYTPQGGKVQVRVEGDSRQIRVSVQDSGAGIAPADLPHIFDRFYKAADSRGSGLGLAIAKSLVAAHGGEISAASEPGKGATITFTIPAKAQIK